MITLEFLDGTVKRLNLPLDKEQKLYSLWYDTVNKKICLTVNNEKTEIKLADIADCYISKDTQNKTEQKNFLQYARQFFP